jgi:hypothetical protein
VGRQEQDTQKTNRRKYIKKLLNLQLILKEMIVYFTLLSFLDFLAVYEIHLKKYDIVENKSYDVTKRKLWEEPEKIKKLEIIES